MSMAAAISRPSPSTTFYAMAARLVAKLSKNVLNAPCREVGRRLQAASPFVTADLAGGDEPIDVLVEPARVRTCIC